MDETIAKTGKINSEADLLFAIISRINDIIIVFRLDERPIITLHGKIAWIYSMGPKLGHPQKRDNWPKLYL